MALSAGARLGTYEVTGSIGAGGMGEVYRARDTRLGRDVAIKILPSGFGQDPHRVARFEREAQLLAALNHPNIAAIYGLESPEGQTGSARSTALVLEFVDGPTLADLIEKGPVPDALAIATQITAALEAAHEQGIIHRDLKPANIKVRPDGTVKVLDFGLAKAVTHDSDSAILSASPTITSPAAMTSAGVLLGTAAYMSPEQARGKAVDKRADIWSFGCVLYEMLAGRRAFEAEDVSLTLAEVMKGDPDWNALPQDLPASVRTAITRCLQKDPRQRFRDMGDVRLALDGAFEAPAVAPGTIPAMRIAPWRRAVPWVAGIVAGALIAAVALWRPMPAPDPLPVTRFTIALPEGHTLAPSGVAVSPDGMTIIYGARRGTAGQQLFRRNRDQVEPAAIPGTESGGFPVFSPDGRSIAFAVRNELRKVAVAGGPAVTLHTVQGRTIGNLSWSDQGQIAVSYIGDGDRLWQVAERGGEIRELTSLDEARGEVDHRSPYWLPGGDAVLFTVWFGEVDRSQVGVLRVSTGERRELVAGTQPVFTRSGHLVFSRSDGLWAVLFDPERLELVGEPVPVHQGIVPVPTNGIAPFDIGRDGSLVYSEAAGGPGLGPRTLAWVDRQGRQEVVPVPPKPYTYVRLSPDGTLAALDARGPDSDIWIWSFARETLERLTRDPGLNRSPAWAPDGKHIAFSAVRDGLEHIYWQAPDGSGTPERLSVDDTPMLPGAFSPDGTRLLFVTPPTAAPFDVGMIALGSDRRQEILLGGAFSEVNGEISPDGRWLAYESNESGQVQVYVRPFPNVASSRQQVSTGGGTRPLWSRDGRELFYFVPPNRIMSVSVTSGTTLTLGRPEIAVDAPIAQAVNTGRNYDASADGRRFLVLRDAQSISATEGGLNVALNWLEELKRIVPVP